MSESCCRCLHTTRCTKLQNINILLLPSDTEQRSRFVSDSTCLTLTIDLSQTLNILFYMLQTKTSQWRFSVIQVIWTDYKKVQLSWLFFRVVPFLWSSIWTLSSVWSMLILTEIINPPLQPELSVSLLILTILTVGGAFTDLSATLEICQKEADV